MAASNYGYLHSNRNYYGVYFQDDWKVTPRLTLISACAGNILGKWVIPMAPKPTLYLEFRVRQRNSS